MRVLALVTDAFGGYGGIAQYNRDFLTAMAQSDAVREVVVLPRIGGANPTELPAKVQQLPPVGGKVCYALSAYSTAASKKPFDLIFCGHINASPLGSFLGQHHRAPVWLQTHGIDAWECPSGVIRRASERSALITTVSRFTRRRLLEWANVDPVRVRVLPNTVRPMFIPGAPSETVLAKYGLSGKMIVLTVARIAKADRYKGHAEAIRALFAVPPVYPELVYVIAGDGNGKQDLENLALELGLQSAVHFVGRVSDEDVLALYRSSSAFIMPSLKEGFGIVFGEAAATGLPVIGDNLDGSVDALADGVIGRTIDPTSQSEIISALLEALEGRSSANSAEVKRFLFPNFSAHVDELVKTFIH